MMLDLPEDSTLQTRLGSHLSVVCDGNRKNYLGWMRGERLLPTANFQLLITSSARDEPKFFLPIDQDFNHANIYSYGYDSDWGSTKHSILNVHDFGNNLLEAMRTSPLLRTRGNSPIFLIGHSMGGLVIKKAYISAREHKADPEFAERILCIFFLATPHRGSDYAAVLNNVLKISGFLSSRQYLSDLTTGSTSIELINQDFCRYAEDLHIFLSSKR
ncbi:hypothetical protein ACHAQH_004221 [Verticillium albo-atrum]